MPITEFPAAVDHLRKAIERPLPGPQAQELMAARPARPGWESDLARLPADIRHAGVLALLHPVDGAAAITLTRRTDTVESHRSQISFPGGAVEAGETTEQTALREAREEVSLDPSAVEIICQITPLHVPVSNVLVHPHVGVAGAPPKLTPDPTEVDEIIEVPLDHLMNPANVVWQWWDRPRGRLRIPYFAVGSDRVWGATAMMLAELLTILGWEGPPEPSDH